MSKKDIGFDFLNSDDAGFIREDEDGDSYKYSDGSGYYHGADGSEGYIYSDGSGYFHGADGSDGYRYSDGSGYYNSCLLIRLKHLILLTLSPFYGIILARVLVKSNRFSCSFFQILNIKG